MNREHNQFSKKVPKDAEACNIQVASCDFLTETFVAFVRLSKPVLLEDFCEISKPTRFLVILLGPDGSNKKLVSMGRAIGSLMSDQLFCQLTAYKAKSRSQLVSGLDVYMSELTVMPPSWDNNIRLEPPKTSQTPMSRLIARAEAKEKRKKTPNEDENTDDEDDDNENSHLITNNDNDHSEDDSL